MSIAIADEVTAPPGAATAFVSKDPTIKSAVERIEQGSLKDAEAMLNALSGRETDELREVIARTRRDYNVDEAAMIAKLKPALGEVSHQDIEKWTKSGELQYREIDGKVWYFRREPSNLFRFCPEAIARRDAQQKSSENTDAKPSWVLEDHLAAVVKAADSSGDDYVQPLRHRVTYSITVPANLPLAKAGSKLRVWMPYVQEIDKQQRDVKLISMTPSDGMIAPNGSFNADGSINGAPQRTVYFEKTIDDIAKPSTFSMVFEYTAYAYYPKLDDAKAQPLPADFPKLFVEERLPHISFTPALKAKVNEIVGGETNPLAKARKIFNFIDQHIAYNAEVEYCTVPSFSERALARGRGDCGIQATLFITMCRAAGIPARWQSGWETKRVNNSMHDWAEFYVAPWGWLPADVSYGARNTGAGATNDKVRNFYFGHQDAYRWIVNLDYGSDLQPPVRNFRSEPADFQKGEVELDGKNVYYDAWDFDYEFKYLDGK